MDSVSLLAKLPKFILRGFEIMVHLQQRTKELVTPSPLLAFEHVTSFWLSQSISTAVNLGVFEKMNQGLQTTEEIAAQTGLNRNFLDRLMRLLSSRRIIKKTGENSYKLNRVSRLLVRNSAGSFASLSKLNYVLAQYKAWGSLNEAIMQGQAAFKVANGDEFFSSLDRDSELAETFHNAMEEMSALAYPFLDSVLPLPSKGLIIDIGGGSGANLTGILRSRPELRGVVFDMPAVAPQARAVINKGNLEDRCSFVGGSFFESVPPGGDVYILKAVLHDWSDEHCKTILQQIRKKIPVNGRILIIEMLVGGSLFSFTELMDMQMMVLTDGGRERSKDEFAALLEGCGFKLKKVYPSGGPQFVLEAVAA